MHLGWRSHVHHVHVWLLEAEVVQVDVLDLDGRVLPVHVEGVLAE